MGDEMDSALFVEARVVPTPEAVDAICFFDDCVDHFGSVVGEIVWDVEHDIANQIADSREAVLGDVFKREGVFGMT